MKKQTGIWIDKEKATIVELLKDNSTIKEINSGIITRPRESGEGKTSTKFGGQYVDSEKGKENQQNEATKQFLTSIIEELDNSTELIILGPASMKTKLSQAIKTTSRLKAVKAEVKTADKMTNNQLVAQVKEYFK